MLILSMNPCLSHPLCEFTLSLTTLHYTCYDEIKGIQDLKIYSHAESLHNSRLSDPLCELTINCTCCYDEIKALKTKIYSHADSLSHPVCGTQRVQLAVLTQQVTDYKSSHEERLAMVDSANAQRTLVVRAAHIYCPATTNSSTALALSSTALSSLLSLCHSLRNTSLVSYSMLDDSESYTQQLMM